MIEGLTVTIPGTELVAMCLKQAEFHEARVEFYNNQKEALPDLDDDVPEFSNVSKAPQQMMKDRIKVHRTEAEEMRFYAKYLKASEEYQLDRNDLSRLGVVSSRIY